MHVEDITVVFGQFSGVYTSYYRSIGLVGCLIQCHNSNWYVYVTRYGYRRLQVDESLGISTRSAHPRDLDCDAATSQYRGLVALSPDISPSIPIAVPQDL
jgi:hypothetical protein